MPDGPAPMIVRPSERSLDSRAGGVVEDALTSSDVPCSISYVSLSTSGRTRIVTVAMLL